MQPLFRDLNQWKFITVGPKVAKNATQEDVEPINEEIQKVSTDMIIEYETQAMHHIMQDPKGHSGMGYGIMDGERHPTLCPDGYYLIQWCSEPYMLQDEQLVEGCGVGGAGPMPPGSWVCEGRYFTQLQRSKHWFHLPDDAPVLRFLLKYILLPRLPTSSYSMSPELEGRKPHSLKQFNPDERKALNGTNLRKIEE